VEKVVAFIDDEPILLSELTQELARARALQPDITAQEVLQSMINRRLLLREARRLFPAQMPQEDMLREYIDLKLRAFIKVPQEEVRAYYQEHREELGGQSYEEVQVRIEELLRERELNRRLKQHLQDLRGKAFIKVLLEP